jgi:hypothetical protein
VPNPINEQLREGRVEPRIAGPFREEPHDGRVELVIGHCPYLQVSL